MDSCKKAIELLKSIQHHAKDSLPPYVEDDVRLVFNEIQNHEDHRNQIYNKVARMEEERTKEGDDGQEFSWDMYPKDHTAVVIDNEIIKRNKRVLLAYVNQRVERLKHVRWVHSSLPAPVQENLSPAEVEFYTKYDQILTSYMGWGEGVSLDLTVDIAPPRALYVQVFVVKEHGEHLFTVGRMNLTKGSMHRLPVSEAEPLLREGVVELVDAV